MTIPTIYTRLEPGITQRKAEQVNVLYDDAEEVIYKQLGYLRENGAILSYVGVAAYDISIGAADVDGEFLEWGSTISRTGLSLSANTIYYVYLYNNGGTPAAEESATVPVWDTLLNYYKKTGDASRRCIGWIETNGSAEVRNFVNKVYGRVSEIIYLGDTSTGKELVSAGSVDSAWTAFSLAPFVPAHATDWYVAPKLYFGTIGDDGILGLSPSDLGASSSAANAPFTIRGAAMRATERLFTGRIFLPITTAQTYYYRISNIAGTTTYTYIEAHGARIIR